jgi:hypothetical protein
MNLLQSHPEKSRKNAAWKTGFQAQIRAYSHPLQTPVGYEKGNLFQSNLHKMNNIRNRTRYLSVNGTTLFLPLFDPKTGIFSRKLPSLMRNKTESHFPAAISAFHEFLESP